MPPLKLGIIGGSGVAAALASSSTGQQHTPDTSFGPPSAPILETTWANTPLLILSRHGQGHTLNPSQVPYRANIFALRQLGCTHIIATGAVGSLRDEFKPGDLLLPDQLIDRTTKRPNTFYDHAAVHVEFAEPFCSILRQTVVDAAKQSPPTNATFHDRGCYVCMEGPAFSTRAESLAHRLLGGDLIGMTACPEAKLAREAEISYALIALVTDFDCWKSKPKSDTPAAPAEPDTLLKEIIANLTAATDHTIALIRQVADRLDSAKDQLMSAPAQQSLKRAIWSDKSRIDPAEIQRLAPLWGRYFEPVANE